MSKMIDTYFKSKEEAELRAFCEFFLHALPICRGRSAQPACECEGITIEAQEAVGDPDYWYGCVRAPISITPSGAVEIAQAEEAAAVCGKWS